jgi:hypothetical protein
MQTELWILPAALLKGALVAVLLLAVLNPSFVQAIVVASCSATITGVFLLLSAWVSARHTVTRIDEVASKVEQQGEEAAP